MAVQLCNSQIKLCVNEGLLVHQAVRKGAEELIGGVVLNQDPLAHGQSLSRGSGHHIRLAGIDEHLHKSCIRQHNALGIMVPAVILS